MKKELGLIDEAVKILNHSYKMCQKIGVKSEYPIEELDHFEALTSRFARLSDLLIQKIFRLIDELDLETPGTVRDRINRAEKKGLIPNAEIFVNIRLLRNDIAHEYMPEAIQQIFQRVMKWTPELLKCVDNIKQYCLRYQK